MVRIVSCLVGMGHAKAIHAKGALVAARASTEALKVEAGGERAPVCPVPHDGPVKREVVGKDQPPS